MLRGSSLRAPPAAFRAGPEKHHRVHRGQHRGCGEPSWRGSRAVASVRFVVLLRLGVRRKVWQRTRLAVVMSECDALTGVCARFVKGPVSWSQPSSSGQTLVDHDGTMSFHFTVPADSEHVARVRDQLREFLQLEGSELYRRLLDRLRALDPGGDVSVAAPVAAGDLRAEGELPRATVPAPKVPTPEVLAPAVLAPAHVAASVDAVGALAVPAVRAFEVIEHAGPAQCFRARFVHEFQPWIELLLGPRMAPANVASPAGPVQYLLDGSPADGPSGAASSAEEAALLAGEIEALRVRLTALQEHLTSLVDALGPEHPDDVFGVLALLSELRMPPPTPSCFHVRDGRLVMTGWGLAGAASRPLREILPAPEQYCRALAVAMAAGPEAPGVAAGATGDYALPALAPESESGSEPSAGAESKSPGWMTRLFSRRRS